MSIETDRPVVHEHPRKTHLNQARGDQAAQPEAGKPGWIDMDVRWLVTRQTVGADETVFGVTYFPPGSGTRSTGTRMPRRSST